MSNLTNTQLIKPNKKQIMRFILPSAIGVLLFLCPIIVDGQLNIAIGIISETLADLIKPIAAPLVTLMVCSSAIFSLIVYLFPNSKFSNIPYIKKQFSTTLYYLIVRLLGAVFALMCYFQFGISYIYDPNNGTMMLGLLGTLVAWFFAASFLMPLLMNYGIMEYVGTLLRDFTRPLFLIPGRAAIDLLASWVGNCNVGVVLTSKQYEEGYYTAREAIIISTCFSAVSLPFCLVVAAMLGVDDNFAIFYLIISLVGILATMIMSRIPPLSTYPNTYYEEAGKQIVEDIPENVTKSEWALHLAVKTATKGPDFKGLILSGIDMFSGIIFTLTPTAMCYGTIACILANNTPIFEFLSLPFGYYLQFLGLEDAFAAAPATIVGFTDMLLPAILAANVASYKTRFVVGALSLVQIIYMTEVGTLILTSKMPVKFTGLIVIFLEKTIIALPIITLLATIFGI